MNLSSSIAIRLNKPRVIWMLFALILLIAITGLGLLSRHALRLSHEQSLIEQREDLQQDIRVALWRLDSRLAPFIATVHGRRTTGMLGTRPGDFVITRFRIGPDHTTKNGSLGYLPAGNDGGSELALAKLTEAIPLSTMLAAVIDLVPEPNAIPSVDSRQHVQRSKSQQYSTYEQTDQLPQSRSDLVSRNAIVQQQVSLNRAPEPVGSDLFGSDMIGSDPAVSDLFEENAQQVSEAANRPGQPMMISVWVGNELVVARSGSTDDSDLEGVWIDWPGLRESLLADIDDLMPAAAIRPLGQQETVDADRTLASLPAVLEPADVESSVVSWSTTHDTLLFAWFALIASSLVAALAVHGLISLSERRASFVSAVTHELRTPLTTFRLYSDLLARDMVSDPADRADYLQTLCREADRLTHLVDNVLRYSKLQRTTKGQALEIVQLSEWIERMTPRLSARLSEAEMELVIDVRSDGPWKTDPPAMEQAVFNLIDNAAKYANPVKDRRVHLVATWNALQVTISVRDHGLGVPAELEKTIFRPFEKSAKRAAETAAGVGLGLALVKQTAIALGGNVTYGTGSDGGACFQIEIPNTVED